MLPGHPDFILHADVAVALLLVDLVIPRGSPWARCANFGREPLGEARAFRPLWRHFEHQGIACQFRFEDLTQPQWMHRDVFPQRHKPLIGDGDKRMLEGFPMVGESRFVWLYCDMLLR